jgi:uncharacterized membrane protein
LVTAAVASVSQGGKLEDRVALVAGRLASVDLLRGIVMVLMVLDHTRDFFGQPQLDPTDLARVTAPLFLTRWVTHFCAPIFVFLAGAGAYLARALGKVPTSRALAAYLATRGAFLIAMEWTLVRWGWHFNFRYQAVVLQVMWVIGLSMLLLASLLWLGFSTRRIGMIGVILILCHNLFDLEILSRIGGDPRSPNGLWVLLLRPGAIPLTSDHVLIVGYPLLPWFGVMAAGFGFGPVLLFDRGRRIRLTAITAIGMVLLFLALRAGNVYGDPRPWTAGDAVLKTVLSFINCQKYPPSLLFVLMTLGPGLLALAAFEATEDYLTRSTGPMRRVLETLGRVPLFFYVLQWPVIHILTNLASWVSGQPIDWYSWSFDYPSGYGYSLPVVYAMWVVVVAILYVPSRWYAGLKKRHRDWAWLGYL